MDVADYVTVELTSAEFISGVANARVAAWAGMAGVQVLVRVQNITDDITVGTGVAVTSVVPVTQTFPLMLSSGTKRYRLQVSAGMAGVDIFAIGQIQVPI